MKQNFLIITLFCTSVFFSTIYGEESLISTKADLATQASDSADLIKKIIGDNWLVIVKDQTITIESKFDIFHVQTISRPTPPPPIDATKDSLAKQLVAEKYIIRLRFDKPLDRDELLRRRQERQKHADVLNFGASSKTAWGDAAKAYSETKVPRYRKGFCEVYRQLTDSPGRQVYPITAVSKIGAAKELLDTIFRPMRTGSD